MKKVNCVACGKVGLSRNEIGINKKLLGDNGGNFYCLIVSQNIWKLHHRIFWIKLRNSKRKAVRFLIDERGHKV